MHKKKTICHEDRWSFFVLHSSSLMLPDHYTKEEPPVTIQVAKAATVNAPTYTLPVLL